MPHSLIDDLSAAIDKTKLSVVNSRKVKEERTGGISFVYHDALSSVNIYKYAGNIAYFDGRSYVTADKGVLDDAVFSSMRNNGITEGVLEKNFASMMKVVWRGFDKKEFLLTKRKLCFTNCILDVDTKKTYKFAPEHFVINRMTYDYDPKADCPKWKKFLSEVLPDESVRNALQEYLGLMFVDRHKFKLEKMMVLIGTGRNGKSVVFEVITALIGIDNVTTFELGDLIGNGDKQKNIASIDGKTINYCSELNKKELTGSKVKSLISGEPTMARQIYSESFTARNIPLMIANANELPATSDHTKGYFSRFFLIPFDVYIPIGKQNTNLHTEIINDELSGIFNWVIEGHERVSKNGYRVSEPTAVLDKVRDYEISSSSILTFLEESEYRAVPAYKNHNREESLAGNMYKEYREFCDKSGTMSFSSVKFAEKLSEKGFEKNRKTNGICYSYYRKPSLMEYAALLASGKIEWTVAEFNYYCGYSGKDIEGMSDEISDEMEYTRFEEVLPF